ncbi:hypothetical protein B7494_g5251 [Chlorociboria aeruginascens]|nr:hypothetical protein B7494_g5251 [Chlorociboria aeruginascens]
MAIARPIRVLGLLALGLWGFFLYHLFGAAPKVHRGPGDTLEKMDRDPNLDYTGEPEGVLWRADKTYAPGAQGTSRINATLLALVRNDELEGMVSAMKDLERTWNSKFNYPWTFFNEVPFSEEFKRQTQAVTKAECRYELIPKEHWEIPSWIDKELFEESGRILKENEIQYGNMASYHQMCRWNSGLFYKHPALADTQYYWRVEPKVHFFCDVDYDVFRYMADNNKTYGFTINLYDAPASIPTLWPETIKFIAQHPEYMHDNNAIEWLRDSARRPSHNIKANGYSTCHFWSNFEIADMSFWRSQAYEDYFNHLDRAGGFFYERWGDAPVHSIALGLFEDSSKIHCSHLFPNVLLRHLVLENQLKNMASAFEERIEKACKDHEIPGAIVIAGDRDGKFKYSKAFGVRSLKDPSKHDPLKLDATMWIASCSKLVTTVAIMQLVECGHLKLDDDVYGILPELKDLDILTGFNEAGQPTLIKNHKSITLRHLLTHSSGLSYSFNPLVKKYQVYQGADIKLGGTDPVNVKYLHPLLFSPGDAWEYSGGLDWAGLMVERISGDTLNAYFEKNIWGPLGIKDFTFYPESNPEVLAKLTDMSARVGGINKFGSAADPNAKVVYSDDRAWPLDSKHNHGGGGLFGSPVEYFKLLKSICANDGKVLKPSTVGDMFKPQLTTAARESLMAMLSIKEVNDAMGGLPLGTKRDWGLGGLMLMEDLPSGRKKGSMSWGGYPNLLWFIDMTTGMCGIYGSQIIPPGMMLIGAISWRGWVKEGLKPTNQISSPIPRPRQTSNTRPNDITLHPPNPHIIPPHPPIHARAPDLPPTNHYIRNRVPSLLEHHNFLPAITAQIPDPHAHIIAPAHRYTLALPTVRHAIDSACVAVKAPDRLCRAHVPVENGPVTAAGEKSRIRGGDAQG